jgi:glycosyltransferase involved in cell wall biosynthesis
MDQKGGNLLSFSLMKALLLEPNIDLLHAHSGKRLGGIVRTVAKIRRIPYVISLHGGIFDVPVTEQEALLEPIRGKFEWGKPLGMMLGSRRVLQDASAIVCVGQAEYEAARHLLPGQRVEYLKNGVDCARFRHGDGVRFRLRYALGNDAKIILCISRIDPQKGQLSLVDAMPQILESDPNAHLVLIGPVTRPAYLNQIQNRIRDLGLQRRVLVLPGIRPGDRTLIDAYHAADVFCLPSIHEPFGIVILEAWAAGCPVVATRVGGIPGFAKDGHDALLVKPDCPEELSGALAPLLGNPGLRARLGESGRRRVIKEFDWSVVTNQLISLYQSVCSEAN